MKNGLIILYILIKLEIMNHYRYFRSRAIYLGVLSVVFLFANCTNYFEDWQEQTNNSIVKSENASVIRFYDNYGNDADTSNRTGSLSFPQAAFDQTKVLVRIYSYNFPLLNEELTKREYARQSYIGNDSNNAFVYFRAQALDANFISNSKKQIKAEINFRGLNATQDYQLLRIKVPQWITKSLSNDSTKGLNNDELYYLISGRISSDSLAQTSFEGETNLSNWELVSEAVINRIGNTATAKFNLDGFDYIYCLAAHFLPFEIIKDVSCRQQGVSIMTDSYTKNAELAGSNVNKYYYVHLDMLPRQDYFYKEFKKISNNEPDSIYKYIGFYAYVQGFQDSIRVNIFETVNKLFPNSTITEMKYEFTENYRVIVDEIVLNFMSSNGILSAREIKSGGEYLSDEINRLEDYFRRIGTGIDLGYQHIDYYTGDTTYRFTTYAGGYQITLDHNFNFTGVFSTEPLFPIESEMKSKLRQLFGTDAIEYLDVYVEDEKTINFFVVIQNKVSLILDFDLNLVKVFQKSTPVTTLPAEISFDIIYRYYDAAIPNKIYLNSSVNGELMYQINITSGETLFYKLNLRSGSFEYLHNFQIQSGLLPMEILSASGQNFNLPIQHWNAFLFPVTNNTDFVYETVYDDALVYSAIYDNVGNLIGRTDRYYDYTTLTDATVVSKISKYLSFNNIWSFDYLLSIEIDNKLNYYKMVYFYDGNYHELFFNKKGNFIANRIK